MLGSRSTIFLDLLKLGILVQPHRKLFVCKENKKRRREVEFTEDRPTEPVGNTEREQETTEQSPPTNKDPGATLSPSLSLINVKEEKLRKL